MITARHKKIIIPVLAGLAITGLIIAVIRSNRKQYLDEHESYLGGDDEGKRGKIRKNWFRKPSKESFESWA
jgi:hypothetical protein